MSEPINDRLERIELVLANIVGKLDALLFALADDDNEPSFDLDGNEQPQARDTNQSLG